MIIVKNSINNPINFVLEDKVNSVMNKNFKEEYRLYAGSPATIKSTLEKESKYFTRQIGFVN